MVVKEMNAGTQTKNQLVIYPLDVNYKIADAVRFTNFLRDTGFISADPGLAGGSEGFEPGALFMKLLTFVGCSPTVGSATESSAAEDKSYNKYSIEIDINSSKPRLISNPRTRSPVCPKCGKQEKNALAGERLQIKADSVLWACPACNTERLVTNINWLLRLTILRFMEYLREKLCLPTGFLINLRWNRPSAGPIATVNI